MSSILTSGTSQSGAAMGDPYDHKPVPNVRVSDVLGLGAIAVLGLVCLYLVAMMVYHWIAGHPPP
ncbi:MAG: hypothetical protein ACREHE_15515 [Rhizomicrobium sp.]